MDGCIAVHVRVWLNSGVCGHLTPASQPVNVVSCGGNSYGQCGSGRGCETQTPVLLPTDWMSSGNSGRQRTISQIVAGANHTALIIGGYRGFIELLIFGLTFYFLLKSRVLGCALLHLSFEN